MYFPVGDHLCSITENKLRDISVCFSYQLAPPRGASPLHLSFLRAPKHNFTSLFSLKLQSPMTVPYGSGLTCSVEIACRLQHKHW